MDILARRNDIAITLIDAATVTINASLGHHFILSTSSSRTLGAPGAGYDGQFINIRWKNTGGSAITTSLTSGTNGFALPAYLSNLLDTPAGETDYIVAAYNASNSRWDVVGISRTSQIKYGRIVAQINKVFLI